eukprot:s451_g4.t1
MIHCPDHNSRDDTLLQRFSTVWTMTTASCAEIDDDRNASETLATRKREPRSEGRENGLLWQLGGARLDHRVAIENTVLPMPYAYRNDHIILM